jgi:hypothetical protein
MADFNNMFPQFLQQALQLKSLLTPVAYLLITGGLIAATISAHQNPAANLRVLGKMIVLVSILVYLPTWGNQIVTVVDDTVTNTLNVNPAQIQDQYKAALEMKKSGDGTNQSWWDKVVEWRASMVEALMTVAFTLLGWIASAIVWWAYILQNAILFIGYALSPIFIGMLAFPSVQEVGRRYLMNLLGVMLWPLGWGVAALVTQGVLNFMTDRSFLDASVVAGNDLYSLQNLMGLAFLGIWLIFSTIAAPVIIQKAIATGSSAGSDLFGGAFAAGRTAAGTGAATLVGVGSGATGIKNAIATGAVTVAAATESLMTASVNGGHGGGSLIGSLAQMKAAGRDGGDSNAGNNHGHFPADDPTGDKTVSELLRKNQNPLL